MGVRTAAFVWSRALGDVRDGKAAVYPAIAQSAAGPVEGLAITGGTFHGKHAQYREDVRILEGIEPRCELVAHPPGVISKQE